MIKIIDDFLDNITMYRLVLYVLIGLVGAGILLGFLGLSPFGGFSLFFSALFLVVVSWATNTLFAMAFSVPANIESAYITALILALVISPFQNINNLLFLGLAAILAMASKYILAIKRKHLFNPAAVAVVTTALVLNQAASWWVGTSVMMPFVLLSGLLVIRKLRRSDLVISFFIFALATIAVFSFSKGADLLLTVRRTILESPLFFFAFIMLTEPQTTPPTYILRIIYGALVGIIFVPQFHIGSFYTTPEIALLTGNLFSYLVSPKDKLILKLKEKIRIAPDIYEFVFAADKKPSFRPGQYMEWTLAHHNADSRGNRRYFTLASSPTEGNLRIGVKFAETSSSFKKTLLTMKDGSSIVAGQLAGDFVLPKDERRKLVFIAGGIGITPFRSMVKYLLDTNQERDIVLFCANKTSSEIVYKDILEKARSQFGMKTVFNLTDSKTVPRGWLGRVGRIDEKMIKEELPDYRQRLFYLSGPHAMVTGFETVLKEMGVPSGQIKVDFFPGYT